MSTITSTGFSISVGPEATVTLDKSANNHIFIIYSLAIVVSSFERQFLSVFSFRIQFAYIVTFRQFFRTSVFVVSFMFSTTVNFFLSDFVFPLASSSSCVCVEANFYFLFNL